LKGCGLFHKKGDFMKTMVTMMVLVIALYFSGCVTTQSGSGASPSGGTSAGSAPASSGSKSGKMLTKEDYDRMGIKEMGAK
jgi:hypothetical protein